MDGDDDTLSEKEEADLRRLIESRQVSEMGDEVREYVARRMPDLVSMLPPRVLH